MLTFSQRMKALVESKLPKYGRFQELERLTGIKNATWQKWARNKQRATEEMIEAMFRVWPAHAFWLATGNELPKEGHTSPSPRSSAAERNLAATTEQLFSYQQRLRDDVMATRARSLVDTENFSDEMVQQLAEAVSTALMNDRMKGHASDVDTALMNEYQAQYQFLLDHDDFLQKLEKLRSQLIVEQHADGHK